MTKEEYEQAVDNIVEEYEYKIDTTIRELRNLNKCSDIEDFGERFVNLKDVIDIIEKNLVH